MRLEKMPPRPAMQNGLDIRVTDPVFLGQLGRRHGLARIAHGRPASSANFSDLLFRQLRFVVGLAYCAKAILVGVQNVARRCYPFQVGQAIIMLVRILVIGNQARRASANESLQDKLMNALPTSVAANREHYRQIGISRPSLQKFISSPTPYLAFVAYFVVAFVSNDIFPFHTWSIAHVAVMCLPLATTLNLQVGASSDDAGQIGVTVNITALTHFTNATDEWLGMRWPSVTIVQGDTIDAAVIQPYVASESDDDPDDDIYFEDADNGVTFTTTNNDISDRTRTTAKHLWNATGVGDNFQPSPSLVTAVQEVINRGGWSSGNALVAIFDHLSTATFGISTYDRGAGRAAKLDIDYTAAGAQTLTPSGIASLEAFGAATVTGDLQTITADAIASAEAFGSAQLNLAFTASGIASLEAFGAASISATVTLSPSGIPSAEAFGAATVGQQIAAGGIASLEAFGAATVSTGVVTLSPSSIVSLEAFGSAVLTTTVSISAGGITSAEAFGSAQLNLAFTASGIASAEAFGAATVALAGQTLSPSGIPSAEAFGSASVAQAITGAGIGSLEAFGSAQLNLAFTASSIGSLEAFGAAAVSAGTIVFSAYGNWRRQIDTPDYPSGTQFFFEAVIATNNAVFPSYARLYNITDAVVVTDSEVQSVNTTDERVRSVALTLPSGAKEYRCERGGVAGATYYCYSADVLPKSG